MLKLPSCGTIIAREAGSLHSTNWSAPARQGEAFSARFRRCGGVFHSPTRGGDLGLRIGGGSKSNEGEVGLFVEDIYRGFLGKRLGT